MKLNIVHEHAVLSIERSHNTVKISGCGGRQWIWSGASPRWGNMGLNGARRSRAAWLWFVVKTAAARRARLQAFPSMPVESDTSSAVWRRVLKPCQISAPAWHSSAASSGNTLHLRLCVCVCVWVHMLPQCEGNDVIEHSYASMFTLSPIFRSRGIHWPQQYSKALRPFRLFDFLN